jgi:hypothetical protein
MASGSTRGEGVVSGGVFLKPSALLSAGTSARLKSRSRPGSHTGSEGRRIAGGTSRGSRRCSGRFGRRTPCCRAPDSRRAPTIGRSLAPRTRPSLPSLPLLAASRGRHRGSTRSPSRSACRRSRERRSKGARRRPGRGLRRCRLSRLRSRPLARMGPQIRRARRRRVLRRQNPSRMGPQFHPLKGSSRGEARARGYRPETSCDGTAGRGGMHLGRF